MHLLHWNLTWYMTPLGHKLADGYQLMDLQPRQISRAFVLAFSWQATHAVKISFLPICGTSMANSFALSALVTSLQMEHSRELVISAPPFCAFYRPSSFKLDNQIPSILKISIAHYKSKENARLGLQFTFSAPVFPSCPREDLHPADWPKSRPKS